MQLLHISVSIAGEAGRRDAPVANATLFVRGLSAQLHRPQRPRRLRCTLVRRLRHDFKLMNRSRFLPMASAQTISARVSATDDDHVLAVRKNVESGIEDIAMAALVLLRQEFHREMDSLQFPAWYFEITRMLGASRQNNSGEVASQVLDDNISSNLGICYELHAFGGHLFKTTIDNMFLELEFRNSVAEQSTDPIRLFVNRHLMSSATELLGRG